MISESVQLYTHVQNLVDLVGEINPDSIVSRTVHNDDRLKVTLFGFAQGQELTEHTASKPAIIHILKGEAQVTMGDESHDASIGAWFHMPPHLPHSLLAKTEVVILLIMLKG